jgi:hypothetical protein
MLVFARAFLFAAGACRAWLNGPEPAVTALFGIVKGERRFGCNNIFARHEPHFLYLRGHIVQHNILFARTNFILKSLQ